MSKTTENLNTLSTLLNTSGDSEAGIDDAPVEFKRGPGRPRKVPLKYNTWCGMTVPEEIYSICVYLKDLLEDQNKYAKSLDIQIFNTAVQFYLYNDLIKKMIEKREIVPVRSLTTTSEAFRRSLAGLGLLVMDKKGGVSKEQTAKNPMADFINAIGDSTNDIIAKKPKKKGVNE